MSIWNKVFVGLTIVVAMAYFFFAARALKARSYWGETIKKHEDALATVAKEKQFLLDGNPAEGKPGVRQLAGEVHQMVLGRGRVWRGSMPRAVKAETGEATVMTQLPAPHRNSQKAQMFVFEEPSAQSKGAFLGEFSVGAVADRLWQLQPVRPMTEAERERLKNSRGPWSLCEVMPGEPMEAASEDAAAPKADQTAGAEAAKKEDAQLPKVGSPEWLARLTDYHVLFNEFYRQRTILDDLTATTTADTQAVEKSEASARQGVDLLRKDIAATKEELKAEQARLKLMAGHRADLEAKIAQLKDAAEKTDKANRVAASELARVQLEAIRRIDERIRKVARAAAAE